MKTESQIELNENFNPEKSLETINAMLNTAKNKLADDGFLYIFWGWLVCFSSMFHFVFIKLNLNGGEYVWTLMPIGGIFSAIYAIKQNKKETVKTYVDDYLKYLWIAFGISLLIALFSMPTYGIKNTYFFLMILYGFATMASGGILNFRPLIIGSLFAFVCALLSNYFGSAEQLVLISLSLLFSYIIPGHMLRNKYKSELNA
jgi:hypothetical protein